jgi:Zn-dependent protease/predicted transcriptional regulator
MAAAIRIGRILGVPIYLHLTFLLILPLFVYIFSAPRDELIIAGLPMSFRGLEADLWVKYVFGTAAALVFFGTVLAHELAHSFIALRYGVSIRNITLMVFGGVASMEELPREPQQEWRMAFAGPFTSLMIGLASYGSLLLLQLVPTDHLVIEGMTILLGLMAVYNLLLAGFNMIPAFPMDGGRVLRAYFASRMTYIEATKKAARIGRYFAIGMGVIGIFYSIWFIIIALFVYIAATEEEQATTITESLQGLSVRDLMTKDVQVVHPDTGVQQLHDIMLSTRHMGFPVVDKGLVGIVTLSDTHKVPKDKLPVARVRDIMTPGVVSVRPEEDAARALKLMSDRKIGRLVVQEDGRLVGIVTRKDFLRAIDLASAKQSPIRWGEQFEKPPPAPPM